MFRLWKHDRIITWSFRFLIFIIVIVIINIIHYYDYFISLFGPLCVFNRVLV